MMNIIETVITARNTTKIIAVTADGTPKSVPIWATCEPRVAKLPNIKLITENVELNNTSAVSIRLNPLELEVELHISFTVSVFSLSLS